MAVLDDLSGFEFEDLIEDVFRNLGYENVRQAEKTADEGRDVIMEEVVDGTRRAVVVECKHTAAVGRPVVQKLHSAISTFDFDGPKRGMVVTTGRFTSPATEYADRLQQNDDPYPIELLDGKDLREIADEIGLDLYNGRIEILCDETLRPYDPAADVDAPVSEAFRDIENIEAADLPDPHSTATFRPVVTVTADTNAVFETSVGVIHRINDRTQFLVHAERGNPQVVDEDVAALVTENFHTRIDLDSEQFGEVFDDVEERRFGQTQTEYKEWAVDRLQQHHTTTVTYTGDNNVTYNKTCEPNHSDISVQSIEPVYLPEVRHTTNLGDYTYPYEYFAAGPSRITTEDGIHRCVHCETNAVDETYTYCPNCGAIACQSHVQTERLEQEPVCTGCAVTERFALKTKYFYDEENLEAFREEYAAMPHHEKAMENKLLAGGGVVATLLFIIGLLVVGGLI
ncbi:restriction endonuclease [Halobacterium salinarum]|uniref:restriction endonuclease n=1 Tax=Halobacterium salinarum TaxID=2242 RepID=UPI0025537B4B|nr:restriction endonuclease [Halobacterium salinarum]MDL0136227.1 restriction endonuclease [Halobacterium salinarum]MDL0138460.1 restriction endonuclease [Halobacterium salinarum]